MPPPRKLAPANAAASATFWARCQFTYITATSVPSATAASRPATATAYKTITCPRDFLTIWFINYSVEINSAEATYEVLNNSSLALMPLFRITVPLVWQACNNKRNRTQADDTKLCLSSSCQVLI